MTAERDALTRWENKTEWPLAALALVFLASSSVEVLVRPGARGSSALEFVAVATWVVFAIDYGIRLTLASDRRRWFVRHLLDLAVVALPLLRPLRLVLLLILFGALQKAVGNAIRGRVVAYTVAGATLLVYVASLAVLQAERSDPDADITSFGQAVWWSIATITTVGYGDTYPVTTTGRVVAVLLMIGGISLVGTITATIASWIVQRVADKDSSQNDLKEADVRALRQEIRDLREELARR